MRIPFGVPRAVRLEGDSSSGFGMFEAFEDDFGLAVDHFDFDFAGRYHAQDLIGRLVDEFRRRFDSGQARLWLWLVLVILGVQARDLFALSVIYIGTALVYYFSS
jgi:hypothetical protein